MNVIGVRSEQIFRNGFASVSLVSRMLPYVTCMCQDSLVVSVLCDMGDLLVWSPYEFCRGLLFLL